MGAPLGRSSAAYQSLPLLRLHLARYVSVYRHFNFGNNAEISHISLEMRHVRLSPLIAMLYGVSQPEEFGDAHGEVPQDVMIWQLVVRSFACNNFLTL